MHKITSSETKEKSETYRKHCLLLYAFLLIPGSHVNSTGGSCQHCQHVDQHYWHSPSAVSIKECQRQSDISKALKESSVLYNKTRQIIPTISYCMSQCSVRLSPLVLFLGHGNVYFYDLTLLSTHPGLQNPSLGKTAEHNW